MGAEEVHVDVAWPAMGAELEVMVLDVAQAVAHLGLAAGDCARPDGSTVAFDADLALDRLELRRQPELWSDRGRPQLRASEVEVVPALEDMIREFVPRREAHAARRPISIDDIAACDFRLFAAILREAGNHERVAVRAEHRTATLVKPLGRNAHDAGRRLSP